MPNQKKSPGRRVWGAEVELHNVVSTCECGSRDLTRISGEELNIREMELEAAFGGSIMCGTCGCSNGNKVTVIDLQTGEHTHIDASQ